MLLKSDPVFQTQVRNYFFETLKKDKNGKPIIDEKGFIMIQPKEGFVIKAFDQTGQKWFINITSNECVDS